ncbi:MAG: TauD/TfdA family dioxygenase [Rhodoferax sp.]|nr:TauD/TfdA family dioxygenase [Rhodoferax sp.]
MKESAMEVRALAPSCGAEVFGLSLPEAGADAMQQVHAALAQHAVLFFRDQRFTPEQQLDVTRLFGPILRVPYIQHMDAYPDIIAVQKEADERRISNFGGTWHSDFSFLDEPPSYTLLYALELPALGGDTLWASQYAAYEALSDGMQRLLDPLWAVQTAWPHGTKGPGPGTAVSRSVGMVRNDPSADREVLQPVVRVHPVTRRKALFVNPVYTQRFEGMGEDESRPLLNYLFGHATRAEFTCRLRWAPGTLAVWDNRCLLHLAINDYDGSRRLLHRTTVAGERAVVP